ncbi:NLR family CARD domain-containing protein 3-like [Hoplias malabaricus]|uniref:NLR family CARD domain-containing protein 3-like n=1 Tax=Hoplias malabaricus TaxID=27720 RepID=UPI003461EF5C
MKSDQSMMNPPRFCNGGEPSCVSMNSDRSMRNPPRFSEGGEPSCVSMKSDRSMRNPPRFNEGGEHSCVSLKSDRSMRNPPRFSEGGEPSCVSMKSEGSMRNPPRFNEGGEHSCVSLKSDRSMRNPPRFSEGGEPSCVSMKSDRSMRNPPRFSEGGEPSCVSMKSEGFRLNHSSVKALHTLTLEEGPGELQQGSYPAVEEVLHTHRTRMKNRYENLFEGVRTPENKTLLNSVYTQLYIIEGESEGVNEEHEVLQMEKTPRRHQQDAPIHCSDIFKPLQGPDGGVKAEDLRLRDRKEDKGAEEQEFRRVLTKGIAGIGKTVSVQKFILDWAEGTANQEVDLMFVLPFRELNLIKDDQYTLHGLLCAFHPELRDLNPEKYDQLRAVFIFDGLDESRVPLDFKQCEKVSDITMTSSVGVLMTNLIRGDLLPSALIWITSRPAAANHIPPLYIHRVTEIQGFTDPQKEEYFRKRIKDQAQAQKIISHIKTARSLHIMCHIPIFCWISATILQRHITQSHTVIPKTLTEMYSHFLLTQTNRKKEKYGKKHKRNTKKQLESNRTKLLKLAELAFTQLLKGNVMFYEEDLRESSIDVTEASVYSGIFTEIFKEECVIHQRKVYCFVHLSFQEFLAAVFVFYCFQKNIMEPLQCFIPWNRGRSVKVPLDNLLQGAVNKAIKSQKGHLDLFLRFLLGLSLESNQSFLQGLLTQTESSSERTTERIKRLVKEDPYISTERSINLFLCLSEMKDQSLSREIKEYLNSEKHSVVELSPGQCSAVACMLLTSEEELEELDLSKYRTSEEGYRRLIPAVTFCRKALLTGCNLTKDSCETLGSILQSVNSSLKELDLSNNDLQDSGVELLSAGLKSSLCKLETLRLSGCMITDEGCSSLASALKLNPSHLRELDLSYNHPGDSGGKLLSDLLQDPQCALEKLQIQHGGISRMRPGPRKWYCNLTLDPNTAHTGLSLSEGNRKVESVKDTHPYPDHAERFDGVPQVLSVESLTGRCYWEVEWRRGVYISVSYRGIRRKGDRAESFFGCNKFSWSLICCGAKYWVRHNNQRTEIHPPSHSNRVGVYLDWGSGTLSFYTISPHTHTLTHLHTFTSTFTEPLYAGFGVGFYSSVRLCETE